MTWAPSSPCVVGCLGAEEGRVPLPVAALRLLAAVGALLALIPLAAVFPLLRADRRSVVVRTWCRVLLGSLDVRVAVDAPTRSSAGGALVVANHISWLDVIVLGAVRPGR